MRMRHKIVAAIFFVITSLILCADVLFSKNVSPYLSHILHCIGEGIIVLMFSENLKPR